MKKLLLSALFIMLLSFSVLALETKDSSDLVTKDIFRELKVNDALSTRSVISMSVDKELPKDSFGIYFNEVCGRVLSYTFRIKGLCVDQVPIYDVVKDNLTEPKIIGYEDFSYDCFKVLDTLPVGVNDYEIDANIERELCDDGFMGYRVDWQPALIKDDVAYLKDDWAWWNASGGSKYTYLDGSTNYTVHVFTANGTFVWMNDSQNISLLVVAGGGGGAGSRGGGGGAGGLIYNSSYLISDGSYGVVIGVGGLGGGPGSDGLSGKASRFGSINATAGGGGGYTAVGKSGGSGGGSIDGMGVGTGVLGEGNAGGYGSNSADYGAGGGGGANNTGMNGSTTFGGDGGNGKSYNINGSDVYYAGGGGGGAYSTAVSGVGGLGGGGDGGAAGNSNGVAGTENTGGGGGGGHNSGSGTSGGAGGSGIVIIRYETYVVADSEVPVVNLSYPDDGNITNSSIIDFGFLVVDETAGNLSCNLLINSSYYGGVTALNNTETNVQNNVSLVVGEYFWSVVCFDGYNDGFSDNRSLYVVDCWEDWVAEYGSCRINDTRIKTYSDSNTCGTTYFLPVDNNTEAECNYCSEDLHEVTTVCVADYWNVTWQDYNYIACCDVTGILADCSILYTPYNESSVEFCGELGLCDDIIIDFPIYMDVGVTESVSLIGMNIGYNYTFTLDGIDYDFTANDTTEVVDLISGFEEDVDFNLTAYDVNGTVLCVQSGVLKFRIPFYVTLRFWQGTNSTENEWGETSAKPYKNEFQFVYMQFENGSYRLPSSSLSYLDDMFAWMPFYKKSFSTTLDTEVSFWDKYEGGEGRIKLYEEGNYSIGLISFRMTGVDWPYEFVYPQYASKQYKTKIINYVDPLEITDTEQNYTLDIYISMWEVNKYNVLNNIGWNILVVGLAVLGFVLVSKGSGIEAGFYTAAGLIVVLKLLGLAIL